MTHDFRPCNCCSCRRVSFISFRPCGPDNLNKQQSRFVPQNIQSTPQQLVLCEPRSSEREPLNIVSYAPTSTTPSTKFLMCECERYERGPFHRYECSEPGFASGKIVYRDPVSCLWKPMKFAPIETLSSAFSPAKPTLCKDFEKKTGNCLPKHCLQKLCSSKVKVSFERQKSIEIKNQCGCKISEQSSCPGAYGILLRWVYWNLQRLWSLRYWVWGWPQLSHKTWSSLSQEELDKELRGTPQHCSCTSAMSGFLSNLRAFRQRQCTAGSTLVLDNGGEGLIHP